MESNNTITKYYQLIGECLAFYFFLAPLLIFFHHPLPFGSYLLTLFVTITLFSLSIHYVRNYIIYIVDLAVVAYFVIYIIQFPPISGIFLILFILWRFIVHETNADMQNQMKVISLMLFAFVGNIILFYDEKLVWIAMIFLLVMIVGHQLSHVFIESTSDYKALQFPFSYLILMAAGSVMVFSFFQFTNVTLASLWNKLITLITSIPIFKRDLNGGDPPKLEIPIPEENTAAPQSDMPDFIGWLLFGAFLIVIGGIIIYLARKSVFQHGGPSKVNRFTSTSIRKKNLDKQRKGMGKGFTKKPTNQVRLKVFKFEQLANQKGKGREHSETIEEWFDRYGVDSSYLDLYQQIRYGDSELAEEEIEQFNRQLAEIQARLNL